MSDKLIPFKGFILQARLVYTSHVIGSWKFDAQLNPYIGVIKCLTKNVVI